jgi:hypothetical protein
MSGVMSEYRGGPPQQQFTTDRKYQYEPIFKQPGTMMDYNTSDEVMKENPTIKLMN